MREKIEKFLGDRPRNTAEILEHINSTMRHGTTSQQLGNVLSKDKNIVKIGYIKRSGILSGGYDIYEWATRNWVSENCPEWIEGTPIIVDSEGNFTTNKESFSNVGEIKTTTGERNLSVMISKEPDSDIGKIRTIIGTTSKESDINELRTKGELLRKQIANEIHEIERQGRTLNHLHNAGNLKYQEDFEYIRLDDSVWSFSNIFDNFEKIDHSNSWGFVSDEILVSPIGRWHLKSTNEQVFFASGLSQYLLYGSNSTKTTYRALGILQSTIDYVKNDKQAHDKRILISLLNDVGMAYHILQDKSGSQKAFTLALRELDEDNSKMSISIKDKLRACLDFNLKQINLINLSRKGRKIMIKNHALYHFVSKNLDQSAPLFSKIFDDLSYFPAERWWAAKFLDIIYPDSDWYERSERITKEENFLVPRKDRMKFIEWRGAFMNPDQQDNVDSVLETMTERLKRQINARSDSQLSKADIIFQRGKIAEIRGDLDEAEHCFLSSLDLVKGTRARTREVIILNELGKIAAVRGHQDQAERFSQFCRSILKDIDEENGRTNVSLFDDLLDGKINIRDDI